MAAGGHDARGGEAMSTAGWIMMILSVGSVLSLTVFCFYRVLTSSHAAGHMQDPLEIDTHDGDT